MYINSEKDLSLLHSFAALFCGAEEVYHIRGCTCVAGDFTEGQISDLESWDDPVVSINTPSDLTIRVNVGTLLVNDDTAVTSDTDEDKYILVSLVIDDTTKGLSTEVTTQLIEQVSEDSYEPSTGKSLVGHLGHYKVVANGTEIVGV